MFPSHDPAVREFLALQRYAEARAKYGSRYVEWLRYYGVSPRDSRLDRPEYLGGGKQTISFSEVLATAEGASTNVGDLKGHGIGSMRSNMFRKYFEEHGYVISLMSVRPRTLYIDAVQKEWLKVDKEDFYTRELENIGAQTIYENEVYAGGSPTTVFGYGIRS